MNIEQYSNRDSIIHNWDPRARIISLVVLIVSIATLQSLAMASLGLALSLAIVVVSRISWRQIAVNLRWSLLFLLLFPLILPLTMDGRTIASFSILSVSCEGMLLGSLILMKGLAAVILAQVMLASCPFSVTALAMKEIGVPNSLVQIFLFSYRYIDLLAQELTTTFRSLSARGFERRSDARTAKVYGNALGALLISSLLRSERIFSSMASRCYRGQLATSREWRMNFWDWMKCAIVLTMALALHFAETLA